MWVNDCYFVVLLEVFYYILNILKQLPFMGCPLRYKCSWIYVMGGLFKEACKSICWTQYKYIRFCVQSQHPAILWINLLEKNFALKSILFKNICIVWEIYFVEGCMSICSQKTGEEKEEHNYFLFLYQFSFSFCSVDFCIRGTCYMLQMLLNIVLRWLYPENNFIPWFLLILSW